MADLKDWRGTPILVGSLVLVPQRVGKVLYNVEAEVLSIAERKADTWDAYRKKEYGIVTPAYVIEVAMIDTPRNAPRQYEDIERVFKIRAVHGVTVIG